MGLLKESIITSNLKSNLILRDVYVVFQSEKVFLNSNICELNRVYILFVFC